MELFKNTVKNTLLLFTVGIIVAVAMPLVANLLGDGIMGAGMEHATKSMAGAMWTGLVFGGFGAFHTLLMPTFEKLFGDDKEKAPAPAAHEKAPCKGHGHHHGVTITNMQIQPDVDVAVDAKSHTQTLDAQRAANAGQLQLVK